MKKPSRYAVVAAVALASLTAVHTFVAPLPEMLSPAEAQPGGRPGASGPDQPVVVELALARTGSLSRRVTAAGTLVSNRGVTVRAEAPGRVVAVQFADGARVSAGQVLIRLDDGVQQAELQQAMASASEVQAAAMRADELLERGFGTRARRDEARSALNRNRADVRYARERLDQARVIAPFSGRVGFPVVEVGDYVSAGQEIVNLEDTNPLKLDFRIPEIFLSQLRSGAIVRFTTEAFPGRSFIARISGIDPELDAAGRSVSVRALVPNPGGELRPGLFARVELEVDAREGLLVPEGSVIAEGGGHFVYKVEGNKATRVPIRIGLREGALVEVLQGNIRSGDRVVALGHEKLRDGAAVRLAAAGAPQPAASPTAVR